MMNEKSLKKPLLMISRAMRYRIFGTSITVGIALILVTGIAIAGVFVVYYYPTSTSTATASIYLEDGPNYANAAALGLVSVSGGTTGSPSTEITSGTTIGVNGVTGAENTYLLNVFEVVNSATGTTGPIYLYINGTLPVGVTLYYDGAPMTFSGSDTGSYSIITGTGAGNGSLASTSSTSGTSYFSADITLINHVYISFWVAGSVTGTTTGTLYLQVSVP
jgi:hypothetical protein